MLPNLGPTELILIFLIVLLLFGANRIPEIAKGLGRGIRDFKKGMQGIEEEPKDNKRIE
jgi:sec-independent protein translocase protein TatA